MTKWHEQLVKFVGFTALTSLMLTDIIRSSYEKDWLLVWLSVMGLIFGVVTVISIIGTTIMLNQMGDIFKKDA